MSTVHTVVVLGGTGNIGQAIVRALLDADFSVSVVTRDATTARLKFPDVNFVESDYTYDSLFEIFTGKHAVVSAVSAGPPIESQRIMIEAAANAGVLRFIPSEYGSSSLDQPLEDFKKLMRPKTEIIAYLREVSVNNPTFTWTCLSGGASLDVGLKSGGWGFSLSNRTATIFDSGKARFDSTALSVMALSVVSVLRNLTSTADEYLLIRSFIVTQNDVLAALEDATGSKWNVNYRNSEETRLEGWNLVQGGNARVGIPKIIQGALFNDKNDVAVGKSSLANSLLSLPEGSLREYVKSLVSQIELQD